jgi:hypothetical protein
MKLTTIALASAFALSSTYALASTNQHKSGVRTHHARVQPYNYGGGPNNRGGLVGGDDSGTSARYGRVPYGGPTNANAFGGPVGWSGGVNSNDHAQRMKNLQDSGYDPKNDFNANGTIKTQ